MSITAVIPVRAGSTRVKDKNIRKFADTSLLENKINQLKAVPEIDQIIVSSDSDQMLQVAIDNGVIAKKRPLEYCDEKSKTFNEVVRYIAENEVETDIMMWAPCVCPIVGPKKISEGIAMFKKIENKEKDGDSIATAALIKEYLFDEHKPINFSVENHVTSQNLPNWHYITNGFFIAKTADMAKWGFVYGPNVTLCEVNKFEAVDIDDDYDFAMAEFIYTYLKEKGDI